MKKAVVAIVLSVVLITTGCSGSWISVALADLPVLTQMALNIGTLVSTLQSGKAISASDASAISNISSQASKDLNLLSALYNDYQKSPGPSGLAQIQGVIADINQNLPALLQAAHIGDPVLSARVSAGVNLILATVASFAALLPSSAAAKSVTPAVQAKVRYKRSAATAFVKTPVIASPSELKKQFNAQVCYDGALGCAVK
jgi:hypothetical protein